MTWTFAPLKPCAYEVILADPPTRWDSFSAFDGGKGPSYATMNRQWLRELPVGHLAAGDCLLCLWATFPNLPLSLELMGCWGFRYVTGGAWLKRTVNGRIAYGTGKVLQSGAELFLLGARGRPRYLRRPVKGVIESEEAFDAGLAEAWDTSLDALRREHSRKPDEIYERIETLMGREARRCELFSRTSWPGWEVWGDQVGTFPAPPQEPRP